MSDPPETSDTSYTTHRPPNTTINTSISLHNEPGNPAKTPESPEEPVNVTLRRPHSRRVVEPIPENARVVSSPKNSQQPTPRTTPSPHRPGPQIRVLVDSKTTSAAKAAVSTTPPEVTPVPGTPRASTRSGGRGMRGGAHQALNASGKAKPAGKRPRDTAKKERLERLGDQVVETVNFDGLAGVLRETIDVFRAHNASLTRAGYRVLEEIHQRLVDHHELSSASDDSTTFSSVVTRAVVTPIKALAASVEAHQRAIQSLTKSVESLKNAPLASLSTSPSATSYTKAVASPPPPRQKEPPLPRGPSQRILVRFNGHWVQGIISGPRKRGGKWTEIHIFLLISVLFPGPGNSADRSGKFEFPGPGNSTEISNQTF
ncbi:hypothetical protein C8R47DRAFT_1084333 [Mycena vitilis]|nr:hypothetical protein C8R47DRAFT_1084333 [Mycena vitilis]